MTKKKTLQELKQQIEMKRATLISMKIVKKEADTLYKLSKFFRIGDEQEDEIRQKKLELEIENLKQQIAKFDE